ncbi:hypothetical protein ACFO0A_01185 [Novosphingobium tardum]|jgi:hypothetical protein|uniref:Uncharacterized protein n=1 Tax=Novosphingobium tardum TaxID=1538021 RepID=A0ABV8RK86_9SPHN
MTQTTARPAAALMALFLACALWLPTLSVPPANATTVAVAQLA